MARHLGRRIGQQACWGSPHRAVSAPPTYATHAAHGTTSPRGDEDTTTPVLEATVKAHTVTIAVMEARLRTLEGTVVKC